MYGLVLFSILVGSTFAANPDIHFQTVENSCGMKNSSLSPVISDMIFDVKHVYVIRSNQIKTVTVCGKNFTIEPIPNCNNYNCGSFGECMMRNAGTPIETPVCLCNYGWQGRNCEKAIPTRLPSILLMSVVVFLEIFLIILAIWRFESRKNIEPMIPKRRLVDVSNEQPIAK